LDAELLEPVNRRARVTREDVDESPVGSLVGGLPDVRGVLLRRVVVTERGLDAALRLRGVVGLQRALRRERDPGPGAVRGYRGREAGGAAADHEHVERGFLGHASTIPESSESYSLFTAAVGKAGPANRPGRAQTRVPSA